MPKQIDKLKRLKYKENRLKGNNIKQSLIKSGYAIASAIGRNSSLSVVKVCEREIYEEFKASSVTIDLVISRLNEDRLLAISKQDYATATRVDELLGKYLAMFVDKTENKNVNIEDKQQADMLLNRILNYTSPTLTS